MVTAVAAVCQFPILAFFFDLSDCFTMWYTASDVRDIAGNPALLVLLEW